MLLEGLDQHIRPLVRAALAEDIGSGDVTAELIPADTIAHASLISRETGILCGIAWFDAVFDELDPEINVQWFADEGERVNPDQALCRLSGPARPLLTGERTALNLLQTLSGTATLARRYADAVAGFPVKILDTRKTLPGLRLAQKHAVITGGCHNHRFGLYDGILIKENHITATGSVTAAVHAARTHGNTLPVEIEVENIEQMREAQEAGADILLLDNFSVEMLEQAVARKHADVKLEASGGITLANIAAIAATGVDYISIGDLTKNVTALDLSMRFTLQAQFGGQYT